LVSGLSIKKRAALFLLTCILPLATDTAIHRLTTPLHTNESQRERSIRERLSRFLVFVRNLSRLLGLFNAFAFIRHGYYKTLPARIVGGNPSLPFAPPSPHHPVCASSLNIP
jgi:hypothetical protein